MWTNEQIAYFAGIIDGEGSIYIQSRNITRKNGKGWVTFFPRFQVVNTDKKLMEWIHSTFGGCLFVKNRSNHNPKWRTQYEWFSNREVMDELLTKIIPFLICKKEHAQIMVDFRKTFLTKTSHRVPLEVKKFREECMHNLKVLNKRGI